MTKLLAGALAMAIVVLSGAWHPADAHRHHYRHRHFVRYHSVWLNPPFLLYPYHAQAYANVVGN